MLNLLDALLEIIHDLTPISQQTVEEFGDAS